jgi:putative ABC transport system permease protein
VPVPLLVLALILSSLALFDLAFRPSFRRMALRNVVRRKNEAMLVVAGSLLGTAIITAAFLVGATFNASIRDAGRTRLGPTDEVVAVADLAQLSEVTAALSEPALSGIDGMLSIRTANAAVASTAEERKAEPDVSVLEVDFDEGRRFGGDEAATGLADAGATPGKGDVVLNRPLADKLDVSTGDPIEIFAYGQTLKLQVRTIVPQVGVAGTGDLFVEPGTVERLAEGSTVPTAEPPSGGVLISNTGGVYDGADGTDAVVRQIDARLEGIDGADVDEAKRDLLDTAKAVGDGIGQLFTSIGSFSVLAGILLLVNLFVMLAEERKSEMGMLRAIGLKRNHLMRVFGLEGVLYAVAASVLGVVAGGAVARIIVVAVRQIFATGGDGDFNLRFSAPASSLVLGGVIGLLISLITIHLTSLRISRLNVIAAIRDLPDPSRSKRRWVRLVLSALGVLVGGLIFSSGVGSDSGIPTMAGPAIACFAAIPLLSKLLPRRLAVLTLAGAALVWAIMVFTLFPEAVENSDISLFVVQGVILVAAAVTILAQLDGLWTLLSSLLMRTAGGLPARLGLAYPLARKFRTGMLLGMYALVMFTLTFLAVFSGIFAAQEDDFVASSRAGADLVVDTNSANPVSAATLEEQEGVASAVPMVWAFTKFVGQPAKGVEAQESQPWPITGIDEQFVEQGQPELSERQKRFASDRAAFEAVIDDPGLAIVPSFFLSDDNGPDDTAPIEVGARFQSVDPATGKTHDFTVAGIVDNETFVNDKMNGALVARSAADEVLGERAVESRFYVSVDEGTDAEEVASRLQGSLLANGVQAETFRHQVRQDIASQIGFFRLMQGYLGLGLLIGIAGLGVVMVRAVRERRRQIGMLRAMGFSAAVVRRAFLFEAGFVAIQGIIVGVGLGLLTAYQVISNSDAFGDSTLPFVVPWLALAVVISVPLVVSLLATAAPANQASKIRPAAALRLAD